MDYTSEVPTAPDVLNYLGWSNSARNVALVNAHLETITATVRAYTRDRGFSEFGARTFCHDSVRSVIISACARSVSNPSGAYRIEAGTTVATPGRFEGFTLAEQVALNRFRQRII